MLLRNGHRVVDDYSYIYMKSRLRYCAVCAIMMPIALLGTIRSGRNLVTSKSAYF